MRRDLSRDKRFSARAVEAYARGPALDGLQVRAAADVPEILMYDRIGASLWDGGGVVAADVVAALADAGGGPVRVRINSPGGDVFEGLAIYNALLGYSGTVEVVVDGVAASAASIIALAGTTVAMQDASLLMIHNASTMAYGTKADMAATGGVLGKIDATLAGVYATKTGKPAAEAAAMMDAETWFTSAEALVGGFVDSVIPAPVKPKAAAVLPIVAEVLPVSEDGRARRLRLASLSH